MMRRNDDGVIRNATYVKRGRIKSRKEVVIPKNNDVFINGSIYTSARRVRTMFYEWDLQRNMNQKRPPSRLTLNSVDVGGGRAVKNFYCWVSTFKKHYRRALNE